jgi:hypothetical protein
MWLGHLLAASRHRLPEAAIHVEGVRLSLYLGIFSGRVGQGQGKTRHRKWQPRPGLTVGPKKST